MRALATFIVVLGAVILGNYWFNPYIPMCRLPVEYTIGTFDERFGVSREEARDALLEAEGVWEAALGRDDIFTYSDDGPYNINFIYDERQRQAEAALEAQEDLATRGGANEVLTELHNRLVEEYEALQGEYNQKLSSYEARMDAFNAEVARYNDEGGAPPDEYEELEREQASLERERVELGSDFDKLEALASRINEVGDKGNELIGEYNEMVDDFNDSFAHGHEYTQGDYRGREINIYSFTNQDELVLVLAHELGHALALPHVEDPEAIMHYLMGEQPTPATLTLQDIEAFKVYCDASFFSRLLASIEAVYNGVVNN